MNHIIVLNLMFIFSTNQMNILANIYNLVSHFCTDLNIIMVKKIILHL